MKVDNSKEFGNFFTKVSDLRKVQFLVLHHTQAKSIDEAISMYLKHEVSSHFIISKRGKIYQLVDENNIAYHAGISYWNGIDGLNKYSIGIELICENPYKKGYTKSQMISCFNLCEKLIKKYKINPKNVVSHSDIAYDKLTGFLNRKSDVCELFNWSEFYKNKLSLEISNLTEIRNLVFDNKNNFLFKIDEKSQNISIFKEKLADFGYKITNFNNIFDEEAKNLAIVFKRRFLR